jgi:hypothetical protein
MVPTLAYLLEQTSMDQLQSLPLKPMAEMEAMMVEVARIAGRRRRGGGKDFCKNMGDDWNNWQFNRGSRQGGALF